MLQTNQNNIIKENSEERSTTNNIKYSVITLNEPTCQSLSVKSLMLHTKPINQFIPIMLIGEFVKFLKLPAIAVFISV
jgi:hypothetical protein